MQYIRLEETLYNQFIIEEKYCSKRGRIKSPVIFIINIPAVVAGSVLTAKLTPKPIIGNMILDSFCPRLIFTNPHPQIRLLSSHIPFRLPCTFTYVEFHVPLSQLHAQTIVAD
jgi:hypothetical protein